MGGKQSREETRSYGRTHSSQDSGWRSPSYAHQNYPPPSQGYSDAPVDAYPAYPYTSPRQGYQQPPSSSSSGYAQPPPAQPHSGYARPAPAQPRPRLDRRYSKIADNYTSLEQVTEALAQAGLESSNLIVGIDFTKSNEWTGKRSFNGRSLHHIGDVQNPYEQAISIIGRTLSAFDEDNLIPCFGFGDASTHDQDVFSFYPDERPCNGFTEALVQYRELVPHLRLAGPTSFAPVIEMAMSIVEQSGGQYHVLVIIADGQVTRSVDIDFGQLSSQEQKTVDAIVKASEFPLSIILVGVGDGPWDMMKEFDDNIPARAFDNFQFVNFTAIMSKNTPQAKKETEFALGALMEIPSQYKATLEILGHRCGKSPERVALPPPIGNYGAASMGSKAFGSTSFQHNSPYSGYGTKGKVSPPSYPGYDTTTSTSPPSAYSGYEAMSTAPPVANSSWDNQVCPICLTNPKDMAFGCGHQTCCECGEHLSSCPICRSEIKTKIKLY